MANAEHLLVPIKVQALVIDDIVIQKRGALMIEGQKYAANDGRWSPLVQDYRLLVNSMSAPGPNPFYGATRAYQGHPADQLVIDASSSALPEMKDRGVYLHWVLPSGLRHAYTPGLLDFPALPDQWLIVRFSRRDAALQTKAWFVDSGLVVTGTEPANLLFTSGEKYVARRVGKVVPLDEFAPAKFQGDRTTITALGNSQTGSPTFTASVGENRNILSWHDDLGDLRKQTSEDKIPRETALSYLLLGWYHDEQNEPLTALSAKQIEQRDLHDRLTGWLIEPPGWFIDAASPPPADLLKRRSLFHGMVAHINYWSGETYKGPMLGYPGSPSVEGVLGEATPSFKVGVGNNAEDALVSLVSSEYSGEQERSNLAKEAPNLWKALEAVIYRQPESLVGSWNAAPRDMAVHQNWFSTLEAGKVWFIRPQADKSGMFPADPDQTAAQTAIKPTPEQLAALKQLNEVQSAADAVSREVAALQQDLYARWWKLSQKSRAVFRANLTAEEADCRALVARLSPLRTERDRLLGQLRTLPEALKQTLPQELELRYDAAPRFWTPADPVIIVKNCGLPTKHQFPRPLPCRLPEQIVTAAEVVVDKQTKSFSAAAGITEIATAVQDHFTSRSDILTRLLKEGALVEQAIRDLVERTLLTEKQFATADLWQRWTERLVKDLTWEGQSDWHPTDQIQFGKPGALDVPPHRLAELWGQQPWSPLFLDWQITWFPTPNITGAEQGFGPVWPLGDYDYVPLDRKSLPKDGFTVRGRSLLSPIDGRIFNEPIQTLRELLQAKGGSTQRKDGNPAFPEAVAEILSRYEIVWDETLKQLAGAGMMGQALTGFHEALLRRNTTLPRVSPDPAHPWIGSDKHKSLESEVRGLLDALEAGVLTGERLAPPTPTTPALPFTMIRAGALRIDELWLVDDFGQWADLLGLTSARSQSSGQVFHPRMRWHDDQTFIAMPPRVVQPMRLNFRFTAADNERIESSSDPALSPIYGWLFYNPLDQALVLCDHNGQLVGELVITKEQSGFRINWEAGAGGVALDAVRNPNLKAFAQGLIETKPTAKPKLHDLLNLIDHALERIRPAAGRRDAALFGRPLALVSAHLGLELFGKAWTDPHNKPAATRPGGTGDAALDALRVRVHLGCLHNTEDGLIGYFKAGGHNRIVPTQLSSGIEPSVYIADPKVDAVRVGFGAPERLTLLMDPWGSVQAACGLVPAKTIALAQAELDKTVAQMEASFRVGPVLLQAGRLALPTPVGDKGRWNFSGPLTGHAVTAVVAADPKHFSDQPVIATEGRLLLLNKK